MARKKSGKIKIVHIIPTLAMGGAERILTDLIRYGNHKKYDFAVVTLVDGGPFEQDIRGLGIPYYPLKKTTELGLAMLLELTALLNRLKPDIVHTHLFGGHLWGEVASKLNRVPVLVFSEQNTDVDLGELKHRIKQVLSYGSSAVVAASEGVRNFLADEEHISRDKIVVIRNAVSVEKYLSVPPPLFTEKFRLVCIGRLERQKGHDILLEALSRITQIPWELTLVGDGSLREDLLDRAVLWHIHDRVRFAGTVMDVAPFLADSDAVVMPSRWEGIGLVIMEGMAAGRPVIASRVGGIPELIEQGKTGLLVPPEDSIALAQAITWMWEHPDAARALGAAAREKARTQCNVQEMVTQYEALYAHLTGQ